MNCEHCLYYRSTKIESIGLCAQKLDYSKQASLVDSDKTACSEYISNLNAIKAPQQARIFAT